MKKIYTSIFVLLLFSISAHAFQVNNFNLKVGSSYNIEVNQSQEISQIIMGNPNTITTENTSLELLDVESVNADGNYTLRLTVLKQRTAVSSPMMSMVEDTEDPSTGSGLYGALKNSSYSFLMSNKGEIISISGLDEVKESVKSQLSGNLQALSQVDVLFNEDMIRSTLELRFSYFPESQEMNWSENKTMTMNAMPIEMATKYSYENNYTIKAASEITIDATTVQMGTNVELDLTGNQDSFYRLNEVTGFPTSFESVNNIIGNAAAAGMLIPMTIETDTKTTFTLQN